MKIIALNIETCANELLLHELPPPEVKLGNTKNPDLIREKNVEALRKQSERVALDPVFGQLLHVTLATRKETGIKLASTAVVPGMEPDVLRWISKQFTPTASADDDRRRLITFNGSGFDVPFLQMRALVHNVPALRFPTSPYATNKPGGEHFDVMQFLHGLSESNPLGITRNLSYFALRLLGKPIPKELAELDQSRLSEQPALAQQLCEWNATTTLELAERIERTL